MIRNCSAFGKVRNQRKDKKSANRQRRMHYQSESLTSNTIEENEIDETNKISLVINTGFNTQDAE